MYITSAERREAERHGGFRGAAGRQAIRRGIIQHLGELPEEWESEKSSGSRTQSSRSNQVTRSHQAS